MSQSPRRTDRIQATTKAGRVPTRRAKQIPATGWVWQNDYVHERTDFRANLGHFIARHSSKIQLVNFDDNLKVRKMKAIKTPARSQSWIDEQFNNAIKVDQDTAFADQTGFRFLLYIHSSMSPEAQNEMTGRVRTLLPQLKTQKVGQDLLSGDAARYKASDTATTSCFIDFTSVEQGNGERGILISNDFSANASSARDMGNFADLVASTKAAIRATSFMYFMLAGQDMTKVHDRHLQLAQITYQKQNTIVQTLLGGPWSPFAQRRLLCNVASKPHADQTNGKHSLNALTFFGKSTAWLVVMINEQPYAFEASPGASILFPAAVLEHFVCGWDDEERFVLTSWTSAQLGYQKFLAPLK